ncbi:MerC domain-containing protein [Aquimarina longa]|uniref:MerC domain-containing protein n=1 Tax=Aquimarina longa TaxID=1080221 RepID=UPI00078038F0|nr:MerC domain-containing protein [Aquimarina longa]
MILIKQKSDIIGTLSSSLCLIHCIATPFLFIAQTGSATCCDAPPTWWKFMDYFFLTISYFAIYWSTKTTTLNWVKPLLWLSWFALLLVIMNEKLELLPLSEAIIYVPAFALMILHLYNKKHCNCSTDKCCTNER